MVHEWEPKKKNSTKMIARLLTAFFLIIAGQAMAQAPVHCIIKTSMGDIRVDLYPEKAPVTVANFLYYVDHQLYDSSSFFRVCTPENEADRKVKIEVIQGGEIDSTKEQPAIVMETTAQTGLHHINGTVSMARNGPNTATSSFFICINDQPELDFAGARNPDGQGFAAFGQVTSGMEVVKKIQKQDNKQQKLLEPVIIYTISRL